ncbi:hypothetical protein HGRIS_006582 [Hohenbuehelia grisea]|uniref:Uncharacterized protein n=1 Tax=Hohenbuehelia grisea TaxID=104357 RepID=A0ABR3J9X9_9AGAR
MHISVPFFPPFASSNVVRHSISIARSKTFNRRNIESPWYPAFMYTLMRLLEFEILDNRAGGVLEHVLYAQPHCDISVTRDIWEQHSLAQRALSTEFDDVTSQADEAHESDDDVGDGDQSSDYVYSGNEGSDVDEAAAEGVTLRPLPASRPVVDLTAQEDESWTAYILERERKEQAEVDADNMDFDRSFSSDSSGKTDADKGGVHTIPDISVAHTIAKGLRPDGLPRIIHQCIIIIEEDKPAPSRNDTPANVRQAVDGHFAVAYQQLALYIAVYFEKDPAAKAILAIASTGPYWRWIKVHRNQVPSLAFMKKYAHRMLDVEGVIDPDDFTDSNLFSSFIALWEPRESYELGTPPSDTALENLRANEIVPLVQACRGSRSRKIKPFDDGLETIDGAEEDGEAGMEMEMDVY